MDVPEAMPEQAEQEKINVRIVAAKDSADIWRIRNTDSVRSVSHHPEPIAWEQHQAWFTDYLQNPDNHCFIVEQDGQLAGYCRIDDGLVSIAIDPAWHGRGLGKKLLLSAVKTSSPQISPIKAEVRFGNEASMKLFQSTGFTEVGRDEEKVIYEFNSSAQN